MKTEQVRSLYEQHEFSLEEFCELSGLSEAAVRELVDCGVIAPADPDVPRWTFGGGWLTVARRARRLRRDLELDAHSVALAVTLLERIRELEAELRDLRARFPGGRR